MKPAHSSDVLSAQPVGKTGNRRPEEAFAHPHGRLRRILHVTTLAGYGARGSPKLAFVRIRARLDGCEKTRLRSLRVGADAPSAQPSEARLLSVVHSGVAFGRTDRNDDCLPTWSRLARSKLPPGLRPAAQTRTSPSPQAKNGLEGDPGVWAHVSASPLAVRATIKPAARQRLPGGYASNPSGHG